jgi:tetratricopeptide (TPR) repeat protein
MASILSSWRLSLLTASVLCACAVVPLQVDRQARAPRLQGYGTVGMAVTTGSEDARRLFAQGMAQAYAFNEAEAVRSFKASLAADPDCALCAWGVAYQLGPTINDPDRGDLSEAVRYVDLAVRHRAGASDKERALIDAMALRYAHASQAATAAVLKAPVCGQGGGPGGAERADPLDIAYAERLRELADCYPDDPDLLSMYAEAEMVATRADWWDPDTGAAGGRMGEVASRLENALPGHPEHTGLNHYLIHAVDAPGQASRAVAAAERLGRLAPRSPHLVHMPSHTFGLLGRYADATAVNQRALALDDELKAELQGQGFAVSKDWRGHNGAYLWFAALMEGRGEVALAAARDSAARAAKSDHEFGEYTRSRPILTLMRLERWDAVIAEPLPAGERGVALVLGQQARGVALARTGRTAEATQALALLAPAADKLVKAHPGKDYMDKALRGLVQVAHARLGAEIALAEGRTDAALALQAEAVVAGKFVDQAEPPMLAAGSRLALGDMQLAAKHWAQAEQSFRTDLAEHPHSGWALRGLLQALQALQAQGRPSTELAPVKTALASSFAAADPQFQLPFRRAD